MSDKRQDRHRANRFDREAIYRMVGATFTWRLAVIFKTLNDYSAFIMKNPDHPAHEAMRNRLLKERREMDARSRPAIGTEAQQARPAGPREVRPNA
jgi:hypothetical protein